MDQARLSDGSVLPAHRRHLDGSERLRLTQRISDVPGLDHALTLEVDAELSSGASTWRRGPSAGR